MVLKFKTRMEHQSPGYRIPWEVYREGCRPAAASWPPAGGHGETNVKKRFKCLDIAVYNILSLLKSGMHLKCIKISVKNIEPLQRAL